MKNNNTNSKTHRFIDDNNHFPSNRRAFKESDHKNAIDFKPLTNKAPY
jgi:hypothetical protein